MDTARGGQFEFGGHRRKCFSCASAGLDLQIANIWPPRLIFFRPPGEFFASSRKWSSKILA